MFQGSFKGVYRKFQGCFKEVSRLFQGSFKSVSRMFQGNFNLPKIADGVCKDKQSSLTRQNVSKRSRSDSYSVITTMRSPTLQVTQSWVLSCFPFAALSCVCGLPRKQQKVPSTQTCSDLIWVKHQFNKKTGAILLIQQT